MQVKRWKKRNVGAPIVRELRGSLVVHEQGIIIITTSGFSKGAQAEAVGAGKTRISLIDGEELLGLLIQHGIGVTQEQHTVLALDDEWWGEVAGEAVSPPEPAAPAQSTSPKVGFPLAVQATVHGETLEAELIDIAGRMRYQGVEYRSPSGAGQVAADWKSCNGWLFWTYAHPDTGDWRPIDELRAQ